MTSKFTMLLMALAISLSLSAQSTKHDIKGSVSALPLIGSSTNFGSGALGIVVKPAVGYHLTDRTSLDLNFSYSTLDGFTIDQRDAHYNSFAFVPAIRYHALNKAKFRLFVEGGFGLGTIKYSPEEESQRTSTFQNLSGGISIINLGVGVNYYFTPSFGLEFILPYIYSRNITSSSVNKIYEGVGPTLGVTFKLN